MDYTTFNSTWARGSFPSTWGNYLPNYIYHNIFKNNTKHVSFQHPLSVENYGDDPDSLRTIIVNSTNIMDDGYPSGGNCWDDYTGIDGDGISDTPYVIDEYNTDRYPLVRGHSFFAVPEVPLGTIMALILSLAAFTLYTKKSKKKIKQS